MRALHPIRRRLMWASIGFLLGYLSAYGLFLSDAVATPHFEALYDMTRPHGALAWLEFQHASEAVYMAAGVVGALLGFIASFARRRGGPTARAT